MAKKTLAQLKKEIASLKKKNKVKDKQVAKAMHEKKEVEKAERELKELKRSPAMRRLKKFSKQNLTKDKFKKGGAATKKTFKSIWGAAGKLVNKLDKIEL